MPNKPVEETGNRGFVRINCPKQGCTYIHRFLETDATLKEPILTNARRKEYLKLQHEAGRHVKR